MEQVELLEVELVGQQVQELVLELATERELVQVKFQQEKEGPGMNVYGKIVQIHHFQTHNQPFVQCKDHFLSRS